MARCEMTAAEITNFAKKFESWSGNLTDNERTLLARMLDPRNNILSDAEIEKVVGGAKVITAQSLSNPSTSISFPNLAPRFSYQSIINMCW